MATDKITLEIEAKVKEALQGLQKAQKESKETEKGFAGVRGAWLKLAGAFAIGAVGIKKAMDFNKEFLEFEQSVQAMERQFGVSSKAIIKELKAVSQGTISTKDIVLSANKAMALGVTQDLGQMSKLLAIARERGKALGVDTTTAFNDIVTGIGRASPLILDNLGIVTKGWAEQAKAAGQAFDAQFILNKVLQDGTPLLAKAGAGAITGAERIQAFKATIDDLRLTIGRLINRELNAFIENLGGVGNLSEGVEKVTTVFKILAFTVSVAANAMRALFNAMQLVNRPLDSLLRTLFTLDFSGGTLPLLKSIKALGKEGIKQFSQLGSRAKEDIQDIKDSFTGIGDAFNRIFEDMEKTNDLFTQGVMKNAEKVTEKTKEELKKEADIRKQITSASLQSLSSITGAFFEIQAQQRQADFDRQLAQQQEALEKELEFLENEKRAALKELNDQFAEEDAAQEEEVFNKKIETLQAELEEALRVGDEDLAAQKQRDIEEAQSARERDLAKAASEKERADKQAAIEEKFLKEKKAKEEAAAAEEKRIRAEQVKAQKKAGIIQSIINTAIAITTGFAQLGPIGGAIAAIPTTIAGAAQIAVIASQPVPQFQDGTDFAPGGPALVGERGPEIVNLPQGAEVVRNSEINNIENNDFRKNTFNFNGIQDLSAARNELLRTEGEDAF